MNLDEMLGQLVICEPATLSTGCWEWPRARTLGYGVVWFEGKLRRVHRIVYEHFVGPIPEGLEPDHLCRNRCCANFEHLELVTRQVNIRRGGNHYRERTHCNYGHPFEGDNLFIRENGARRCRTCKREASRRSEEKARMKMTPYLSPSDQS
jgi:hypothetical protein